MFDRNELQLFMWDRKLYIVFVHDVGGIYVCIILRCPCSGKTIQKEDTQNWR